MDASYPLDPHEALSQMGYIFAYGNVTMVALSSNHLEILSIHETSHECV